MIVRVVEDPGRVLAGEIEAVGRAVTRFQVGDRVWAFTTVRMGWDAQRTLTSGSGGFHRTSRDAGVNRAA